MKTDFKPPATRYQGSKWKLLPWLRETLATLPCDTALDAFGGSGSVSYLLKSMGKQVTYNDLMPFNHQIGLAIIENSTVQLPTGELNSLLTESNEQPYLQVIQQNYQGVFYTDEENQLLDVVAQNIPRLACRYHRALAYYALFQACVIKRPYNLFHRKNLYMRLSDVPRSFGNKRSWDAPFAEHLDKFLTEANDCLFAAGSECQAVQGDAAEVEGDFDLVYLDPPYVNGRGQGVDYADFYHFLNGLVDYDQWERHLERRRKHRPYLPDAFRNSPWTKAATVREAFERLFARFAGSHIVVSYRSDGAPTIAELADLLRRYQRRVAVHSYGDYQYALSTNAKSQEVLLVGEP